ncbi:hypothetical protein ACJIZ3_010042 [Penstemon smallii]|uniref:Uncharacterized protein n=1 Tax=Penstemon smallii TaxID=265156 RepID=A0ABD3TFB3_9LAMI
MKLMMMQMCRGEEKKKHLTEFQNPIRLEKTSSHEVEIRPADKSITSKAFTALRNTLFFFLDKLSTNKMAIKLLII